jgi:hypothetical protein
VRLLAQPCMHDGISCSIQPAAMHSLSSQEKQGQVPHLAAAAPHGSVRMLHITMSGWKL